MKKLTLVAALLLAGLMVFGGCSKEDDNNDDNNPTPTDTTSGIWSDGSGGWYARVNASGYDNYAYFDLENHEFVTLNDEDSYSSSTWSVAFQRINGKLNGGSAGPNEIVAVDLQAIGDAHGMDFNGLTTVPTVTDEQWVADQVHLMAGDWYTYNPSTHQLDLTHNLYVMNTVDGGYAKFVVDNMVENGMPPDMGTLTLRYVYNAAGTDLSAAETRVELDGNAGTPVYFSFTSGGAVTVSDPGTSNDWDLCFNAYDCTINGGISGSGGATIYPMYLETNDFASVTAAPQGGGYFADSIQSVFGSPDVVGTEWYNYDSTVHEIISKGHVYLLKFAPASGGTDPRYMKFTIENYYLIVDGTANSGHIKFHYKWIQG